MLSDQYRLRHSRDIALLFEKGRLVHGGRVQAKVLKIDKILMDKRGYRALDLKIACIVGMKVSKKAVERNKIRRQMRESIRLLLKDKRISGGYLIGFFATPKALETSFVDIQREIINILKKLNILAV